MTLTRLRRRMNTMTTLAFDTHKAVKTLKEAGFEETKAEAMVTTFGNAMSENVATKADIAALKADIAELKAELKADILALEQRLTVRLYTTILTGIGLIIAANAIMLALLKLS